ncbi:MFS transporter [Candidatus Bathyarchaeota archaeon]|nr:MFS transporter [Candidatus Bathyarchaeota archaeon]
MSREPESRWAFLKGNIGVMILTSGIWSLAGAMTWPFFSLYVLGLGGTYVDIGLISAVEAMVRILPTFIGGYLADSVGRKRMVYSMSFLLSLNQLLYAFAPHYRFLLLPAALNALWSGLRDPAFSAIIADSTRPENRALSYAVWNIVPPLFGLLSPYLSGLLMDRYGVVRAMRWAYLAVFATSLIASLLRYKLLEETLPSEAAGAGMSLRTAVGELLSDFRRTVRSLPRQLWVFFAVDFTFNFAGSLCGPYFVTYATEEIGLTAAQWGFISTILTLISTGVRLPAAWASDRYGRLKFMLPCMFLWPVTFFLFANAKDFSQVMAARAAMTVLDSVGVPAWQAFFVDLSPREHRGRINAIASVSWAIIGSAGSVAGGALYEGFSARAPFLVTAALQFIGAVVALLTFREPSRREE